MHQLNLVELQTNETEAQTVAHSDPHPPPPSKPAVNLKFMRSLSAPLRPFEKWNLSIFSHCKSLTPVQHHLWSASRYPTAGERSSSPQQSWRWRMGGRGSHILKNVATKSQANATVTQSLLNHLHRLNLPCVLFQSVVRKCDKSNHIIFKT